MNLSKLELFGAAAVILMCMFVLAEVRMRNVGQLYVIENGKWMPVTAYRNER